MRDARTIGSLLVTVTLVLGPRLAFAQGGGTVAAEALFEDGRKLYEEGKYAEACPKLAESQRLDPATGTLLALALCHEGEGKLASAWAEFREAEGRSRREGRGDREKIAAEHATALRPRLSTLAVHVPRDVAATPGLEVRVDGMALGGASFGIAMPVDGGEHRVEASAPGRNPWGSVARVKPELDAVSVQVGALAATNGAAATNTSTDARAAGVATEEPRKPGSGMRTAALVAAGAGVVVLGVGTFLALDAKSDHEAAEQRCTGDVCPPAVYDRIEDARSQGTVATVLFAVGGAAIATGAVLWFVTPSTKQEKGRAAASAHVERVRLGLHGVAFEGSF